MKTLIIIPTVPGNEKNLIECIDSISKNFNDYHLLIARNNYEGFAKAVNYGLKMHKNGEYDSFLILNDDIKVINNILNEMWVRLFSDSRIGIVCAGNAHRRLHCAFFCVLIKKEAVEKIGLLDERFEVGECEDTDYCVRLKEAGYDLEVVSSHVDHKGSQTMQKLSQEQKDIKNLNRKKFKEKWKNTHWENEFGF